MLWTTANNSFQPAACDQSHPRLWSRRRARLRYWPRNSVFLKSAGTSNTSALTPAVDTDTNSDVMVMSGMRPSGNTGAAGSAAGWASSFFLWNIEPSLPAIAPARPPGVVGVRVAARVRLLLLGWGALALGAAKSERKARFHRISLDILGFRDDLAPDALVTAKHRLGALVDVPAAETAAAGGEVEAQLLRVGAVKLVGFGVGGEARRQPLVQ